MIPDTKLEEACKQVDEILLSEENRKLIKETTDALIKLSKDKKLLQEIVDIQEEIISDLKSIIRRYDIAYYFMVGIIVLLVVL